MSALSAIFKPVNRHMLVVPHIIEKGGNTSGVLLPEDYKPEEERYIAATVVDIAPDCSSHYRNLRRGTFTSNREIVIDRSMLEEVKYKGKSYHVILENYVVGLLSGFGEQNEL